MTTVTHPDREELMAWMDGEVDATGAADLGAHVAACVACRALADTLREASRRVSVWQVDGPPPALAERVRGAADRARDAAAPVAAGRAAGWSWRWPALAALVVVGIFVPLRMQCAAAGSSCRVDDVRRLFGAAPAVGSQPTVPALTPPPATHAPAAHQGGAKVVVTMFIDWQCPACRAAHESYAALLDDLERSAPGAVDFVVKDFPLNSACNAGVAVALHGAACEAAVAVRLAREKGKAHEMVEWLFANQESLTPEGVKAASASIAGVADFDARYADEIAEVRADADEGVRLHVRFTPSCYVNGVLTNQPGGRWLPAEELRAIIERELKKAGSPGLPTSPRR